LRKPLARDCQSGNKTPLKEKATYCGLYNSDNPESSASKFYRNAGSTAKILNVNITYTKMKSRLIAFASLIFAFGCSTENLTPGTTAIYCGKSYTTSTREACQIIKINPDTGAETVIADLTGKGFMDSWSRELAYSSSTNEIVVISGQDNLLKVNAETGTYTTTQLGVKDFSDPASYSHLTFDDHQNLYACKLYYGRYPSTDACQVVKVDKATGSTSTITNLDFRSYNYYTSRFVYSPSSKEIITILNSQQLCRINIETGKSTYVTLAEDVQYGDLVLDQDDNIYVYKDYSYTIRTPYTSFNQIVKIDKVSGAETAVADLGVRYDPEYRYTDLTYLPSTNEIAGLYNNTLLRVNIKTGKTTSVKLENSVHYYGLTPSK